MAASFQHVGPLQSNKRRQFDIRDMPTSSCEQVEHLCDFDSRVEKVRRCELSLCAANGWTEFGRGEQGEGSN